MDKKIKALFFDIDGTLVSFKTHKIPQSTVDALEQAKKNGVEVYISTGRPQLLITNLGQIEHLIDGYITTNGARCFVGDKVVSQHAIFPEDVKKIIEAADRDDYPAIVVGEHHLAIHHYTDEVYEILGEEFIPLAFQYAHEADPEAELYYNDYNMHEAGKRATVVKLVNDMKSKGLRVDAIGMQGHVGLDYPSLTDFEESMLAYASTGAKVMITEWDMSALPTLKRTANVSDTVAYKKMLNPYPESLPDSVSQQWNNRMSDFLNLFIKHSDFVSRVTAWGVSDGDSWKNGFPVRGRKDYALLFDRDYQPKDFIKKILE